MASQTLVFDDGRVLRLGFRRLDEEPGFSRAAWPIAGWGLPAVARREESGRDFAGGWKGSIGRFHSYAVYCLYPVTLRRCAEYSSINFR